MNKILYISLPILLLLILLSCSNPNEVENTAITGKVILVGDKDTPVDELNDYSDVTVSLYNLAQLDTTLVRLNREYPNIGVKISQETEFDFRMSEPIKTVVPDSKGSFKIDKLTSGEYNLVVSKPNWGSRVLYNVAVSKAYNVEMDEIGLYPIVELPMFINEPFIFESNRTYVADKDVTFGSSCAFEGDSRILIGPNSNLNFNVVVRAENNVGYTRFDTNGDAEQKWGGLNFTKADTHLSGFHIKNSLRGVAFLSDNSSLKNSIVENTVDGSYLKGTHVSLSNILFKGNTAQCVRLDPKEKNTDPTILYELTNSIYKDNSVCVRTQGQPVRINNNYFVGNESCMYSFHGYHEIQNNEFFMNEEGIVCTGSIVEITKNLFYYNEVSVATKFAYYSADSCPVISLNNFYQEDGYAIKLWYNSLSHDIQAINNYWIDQDIEKIIYDAKDWPIIEHEVIYLPKASKPFVDAGIIR